MRICIVALTLIFFVGCSQSNVNTQTKQISKSDKKDEFDELDRIDAQMEYELSPATNTMKQLQACPIR